MNIKAQNLGTTLGFVGIGLLISGYLGYKDTQRWLTNTVETSGEIVGYHPKQSVAGFDYGDKRSRTVYYPSIRYQTRTGQAVTFTGSVGSSAPDYPLGQPVTVRYPVDQPQDAQLDDFLSIWLLPLVLTTLGVLLFIAFVGLTFFDGVTYELQG